MHSSFRHEILTRGCFVALIEEQIKNLQHAIQARREFRSRRNLEGHIMLLQALPRACQPLQNRSFRREKGSRDFPWPKSAKNLERQSALGLLGEKRVATSKHQPQAVVLDLLIEHRRVGISGSGEALLEECDDIGLLIKKEFFAAQQIEGEMLCRLHEPGRRIFRNAVEWPRPQCPNQGLLDDVFRHLQPVDPEDAGENGDQLSRPPVGIDGLRGAKSPRDPHFLHLAALGASSGRISHLFLDLHETRALGRHRPNLDRGTVFQERPPPRDLHGILQAICREQ